MKEVLVLSWVGEQSWHTNVQWSLIPVPDPNQKWVLVWTELLSFKKSIMFVPSVLKTTPSPKAKPNTTKALSDGDAFHMVSISVGSNLFLFAFCCCWQKKGLNEEYGAPVMCNLAWMCLHRIGEEQDKGRA